MEDTDWISVPKRTSKSGRKFGLTGRRATFDEQRRVLPSSMTDYSMIIHQEHVERNQSDCNLSEREIEDKFNVISLTIRTEGLTLKHRLEHQHRQRDLVETNLEKEIQSLKSIFLEMRQEVARGVAQNYGKYYEGAQLHGQFSRVDSQVEAVHSSARSISSVAETLGAVEYESRLSAAVELVLMYVDTLKRKWEKEHRELEETKRILKESGVNVAHCLEAFRERNRPRVDSGSSASPTAKRRASFPAAPLRRISVINPAPSSTAPLRPGQPSAAMAKIAEEKDDDGKAAVSPPAAPSMAAKAKMAEPKVTPMTYDDNLVKSINSCQPQATATTTAPAITAATATFPRQIDKSNAAAVRRERRGPGKSKSWTSAGSRIHAAVLAGDKNNQTSKMQGSTRLVFLLLCLHRMMKTICDGCCYHIGKYQRKLLKWRHNLHLMWNHKWEISQLLLAARYVSAVCFLLAALISLLLTFIPPTTISSR